MILKPTFRIFSHWNCYARNLNSFRKTTNKLTSISTEGRFKNIYKMFEIIEKFN